MLGLKRWEDPATPPREYLYTINVGVTPDEIDSRVGDKLTPVDPTKHLGYEEPRRLAKLRKLLRVLLLP